MKCTYCGRKIRVGDEYCSKCGRPLEPDIIYEDDDVRDDFQDNVYNDDVDIEGREYYGTDEKVPKKASGWASKGIAAAICIGVAFVVAIIALNVSNMINNNKADDYDLSEIEETTTTTTTTTTPTTTTVPETTSTENDFWGSDYYDDSEDNSTGEDIRDYLEDVGERIRGAADEYGGQLGDTINEYLHGGRHRSPW